jgi:predicted transcriptional regulator
MSVGVRRSEIEIIKDILRMGVGRTTALRYTVNLSHSQMQKYLAFLERSGLIRLERLGARTLTIHTTYNYLQRLAGPGAPGKTI